jgi:hypothetical protein
VQNGRQKGRRLVDERPVAVADEVIRSRIWRAEDVVEEDADIAGRINNSRAYVVSVGKRLRQVCAGIE